MVDEGRHRQAVWRPLLVECHGVKLRYPVCLMYNTGVGPGSSALACYRGHVALSGSPMRIEMIGRLANDLDSTQMSVPAVVRHKSNRGAGE